MKDKVLSKCLNDSVEEQQFSKTRHRRKIEPTSRTCCWTNDRILPTQPHLTHAFGRPSLNALATRLGKMLVLWSWEKGLWPERSPTLIAEFNWKSFLSFLLELAVIPHDYSSPCWRVWDIGKKHLHWTSTFLQNFPQNWGVLLCFLSCFLWLLQTVVTGNDLLAARYVDRCEGGSLCWSQLPGLANHLQPGQALSPAQIRPEDKNREQNWGRQRAGSLSYWLSRKEISLLLGLWCR